jgi:hypothetical protein
MNGSEGTVSSRNGLILLIAGLAIVFVVEGWILSRNTRGESYYATKDRAVTSMVDRLVFTDSAQAFKAGAMKHVMIAADEPARVTLDAEAQPGFPRDGTWTSPKVTTQFPFTILLPCWNVATPEGTGVVFHVRTRDQQSGRWSPWLRIGGWGRIDDKGSVGSSDLGFVDEDTLKLSRPADAYQIMARLQSFGFDVNQTPSIRRISVLYTGELDENSAWARAMTPDPGPVERWAKDLKVPFRTQNDNVEALKGYTCSPTSVSMVLQHFGVDRPTMENCLAIWDDHNEMFGNWANAVQRAGEVGMDAWLERFRNWNQVKEKIAQGQPVVASIRWAPHEFPDSPIFDDADGLLTGHLIVIRGFTPDGNVIVNDPASRKHGNGVIYPARGLAHAWFGNGGVGYVMHPPAKPLPAALVKSAPATMPTTAPVATR